MAETPPPPAWFDPSPEQPGTPKRHVALVLGLALFGVLLLVGVAAYVVSVVGDRPEEPSARPVSPSLEPPEAPEATPAPQERIDVRTIARQVSALRHLPLRRRVRSRLISQEALADKVSDLAFSENDPEEIEANERLLVALRLAPPDTDLLGLLEELYREQIDGVYVPEERTLYVGGQSTRPRPARDQTAAHEATHVLQDQSFGLTELQDETGEDTEASLALTSLVEGDAVLAAQLWSQQHQTAQQRREAAAEAGGGDALERAPEYLRASLFFPYQEGVAFAATLYQRGGFDAIDDAYANPPTTTEQIMHPDKYLSGEGAVEIRVSRRPPARWKPAATYPLGEFDLRELFGVLGSDVADRAAAGWGGGHIRSWSRGQDTAVAAVVAMETPQDADEVCDAVRRWYENVAAARATGADSLQGDRDHLVLDCRGLEVRFGIAVQETIARRLSQP